MQHPQSLTSDRQVFDCEIPGEIAAVFEEPVVL